MSDTLVKTCLEKCSEAKAGAAPSKIIAQAGNNLAEFIFPVASSEFRQVSVFFFVHQSMDYIKTLGWHPSLKLPIVSQVDIHVKDLTFKAEMGNNAFYSSADKTLNFIPSRLTKSLKGSELDYLDTAYDQVVIVHEFGHLVLYDILGTLENSNYLGMKEGMADFFALNMYHTSDQGIIFGKGTQIRTAIGNRAYQIGLEAHDRGLVLEQGLWATQPAF